MRRKRLKDLETEIREETGLRYSREWFHASWPKDCVLYEKCNAQCLKHLNAHKRRKRFGKG